MTEFGLAHLSLLGLEPDELIRVAAEAGFDFVGVRVRGATPTESIADMRPSSAMSTAVRAAMADTGVAVRDIEFLSLDGATGREAWLPMLEAGAAFGATTLSLAGQDPDEHRIIDTLAELVADAASFGILPTLEPISYNAVHTISVAAQIADAAGAAVLVDPLHLRRGGDSPADVATLDPALVPVLQLCDAPLETPQEFEISGPLPRGMTADGEPRKVESRAFRLPPGDGELPLLDLIRAVPSGLPISVEVPNAPLFEQLGAVGYARYLLERARSMVHAAGIVADA
ncbi:hypothetical protein K8P10_000330 [Leucobacter sp. Psy1]|uniref:sugar phosphate isomerase/epimerase family protein n=1 Tax=Leucobacter sp. Psy1 TaxID=2875729 RepID=UPI001CD415BA|nr:TIM barrel protein [Leucobacter sp. Psy1]UBH04819.1 hypothetical protein K8P10_000330 [Leucobacter sp. Psy1]